MRGKRARELRRKAYLVDTHTPFKEYRREPGTGRVTLVGRHKTYKQLKAVYKLRPSLCKQEPVPISRYVRRLQEDKIGYLREIRHDE